MKQESLHRRGTDMHPDCQPVQEMAGPATAQPDAILFDLDNTLCTFVDAKQAACDAVISAAGAGNGADLFAYFLRPVHNFEDHAHITDYLTDIGIYSPDLDALARNTYETIKLDTISLYPGVIEALELFRDAGVKMAVVTDAHSIQARARMGRLDIDRFFEVLITPDMTGKRKPDHTQFLVAMERLHAEISSTWVVGDSMHREIKPGREIGLTTVFAKYGEWFHHDLPEVTPHFILENFCELVPLTRYGGVDQITGARR